MQLTLKSSHKKAKLCSLEKPIKIVLTNIDIPVILFPYSGAKIKEKTICKS